VGAREDPSIERFVDPVTRDELAVIVRSGFVGGKYEFFTPDDVPLQFGQASYKRGDRVRPHTHSPRPQPDRRVPEFVYVKAGAVALSLFGRDGRPAGSAVLRAGDCVLLIMGGHGLEILEDARLLEVKQGPYAGPAEKVELDAG
jgi:hypothetical protein